MRLTVAIPGLVLMVCVAAGVLALASARPAQTRDTVDAPKTGVELLQALRCRRAETKRILIRGAEDGFSPAGTELASLREGRRTAHALSFFSAGAYDQYQADHPFTDTIETPARVASGLFVISLRKVAPNDNDTISIGDLSSEDRTAKGGRRFSSEIRTLERWSGWRRIGSVYSADLAQITFQPPAPGLSGSAGSSVASRSFANLLAYIRGEGTTAPVDVVVEDDTSVDFMGMAICEEPEGGKGLTLAPAIGPTSLLPGVIDLACRDVADASHVCDPYVGDTPCASPLPVACFRPGDAPAPRALAATARRRSWSGGSIALTEPVPGNRFATVGEVDTFCARRFGADWRAAAFHDGAREGIVAYGDRGASAGRAWVDIADQPYATCWARR